jgi:hypothetical protein
MLFLMSDLSRREVLGRLVGAAAVASVWTRGGAAQSPVKIVVYKDPNCGCCAKWVDHMNANGFAAAVTNSTNMGAIKKQNGVAPQLESCHTTLVGGFVIEGHVPASDVKRLLKERPKGIVGLTIPGMPASAPGMDVMPFQPYTVLTFDAQGKTTVYARHDKG